MSRGTRVITGGRKEFVYTKEDIDRIESEDTESTKEFKEELRFWREHPYEHWWKHNKRKVLFGLIILLILVVVLVMSG